MSDNLRKRIQRRRAQAIKKGRAVSPVVATLILILIAVAAAAALYLWLVTWQGSVTGTIGNQNVDATVTIGGSTSVYPFEQAAVTQFQQNNTDIAISVNQGGTGAGMLAVCSGQVDVGAASTYETVSGLETSDNCPATTVVTTIAWDAVDVIVPTANAHGLQSISWDTLTAIYDGASTTTPTLLAPSIDSEPITAAPLNVAPWSTHAALAWDQIPACVLGVANCGATGVAEAISTVGAGAVCAGNAALICVGGGGTPCAFTVCTGGSVAFPATDLIKPVMRSDASGTTQTFEARLLGATSATAFATSTAGLGFGGCGSNNILADCGMAIPTTGNGNPGVITAVGASGDAIGYASDGLARATGSGVAFIGFSGVGQITAGVQTVVVPSLGATGTISYGAQLEEGKTLSGTQIPYAGVRPFQWVTTNTPTGEVAQLITWVMDPANNINVAADTAEVSVYSI